MPVFLDTRGNPTLGVALCDRCSRKMPIHELHPDPNFPGLRVCRKDLDDYDPYRLPARQPETITLPFLRTDRSLALDPSEVIDPADDFLIFGDD